MVVELLDLFKVLPTCQVSYGLDNVYLIYILLPSFLFALTYPKATKAFDLVLLDTPQLTHLVFCIIAHK